MGLRRTCPYTGSSEISLAYCALFTAVPMVHVPAMHCHTSSQSAFIALIVFIKLAATFWSSNEILWTSGTMGSQDRSMTAA